MRQLEIIKHVTSSALVFAVSCPVAPTPQSAVLSQLFTFDLQHFSLYPLSHPLSTLIMCQAAICQAAKHTARGPPSPPALG